MKYLTASRCAMLSMLLLLGSAVLAEQRPPIALRVVNLGSQPITAFAIVGFPFREVGLEVRPGEVLTPAFADGAMDYELYWRFQDGSVHSAAIDLRAQLPAVFHGYAFISLHDHAAAVTWSNIDPAWIEYRRERLPSPQRRPRVPLYASCSGPLLTDAIALQAWRESVERVRERLEANPGWSETQRAQCDLERYLPDTSARVRVELDEVEMDRLRREWHAEIEKLPKAH